MWCIIVWNVWWKLASKFAKQIPRNRLLQCLYRLHLQNSLWDWARIASATFYSTKSLSIRRCRFSTDPPIIAQKPGVHAMPLLHSPAETLSIRGRDIIAAIIQWPYSFEALEKTVQSSCIEVHGWHASTMKCTMMPSQPAICSWTNSSLRWTCSNAFKMLTQ